MPQWASLQGIDDTLPIEPETTLSELDKALIVSALFFIESRSVWNDLSDEDWDILTAKISEVTERVG